RVPGRGPFLPVEHGPPERFCVPAVRPWPLRSRTPRGRRTRSALPGRGRSGPPMSGRALPRRRQTTDCPHAQGSVPRPSPTDDRQSVHMGKGRCPGRDQQTCDRRGDPQLFLHLAYHRLGGCLPVLDVSAGDLQVVLVGRDHHHHSVEVIVEQGTGRGAGTCEGLGGINCHGLRPTLLFFSIVLHGRAFGRSSFLPPLSPARYFLQLSTV